MMQEKLSRTNSCNCAMLQNCKETEQGTGEMLPFKLQQVSQAGVSEKPCALLPLLFPLRRVKSRIRQLRSKNTVCLHRTKGGQKPDLVRL